MRADRTAGIAMIALVTAACPPEPIVKFADTKDPADIAALRAASNHGQLEQCDIAEVLPAGDWIYVAAADDGFRLRLPPDWKVTGRDSVRLPPPMGRLEIRMKDSRLRSIVVGRVANSVASRGYIKDATPDRQCEISGARHGSIWTLYTFPVKAGRSDTSIYIGLGDLLTAGGKRYHISVSAGSERDRDWLARMVAGAADWQ